MAVTATNLEPLHAEYQKLNQERSVLRRRLLGDGLLPEDLAQLRRLDGQIAEKHQQIAAIATPLREQRVLSRVTACSTELAEQSTESLEARAAELQQQLEEGRNALRQIRSELTRRATDRKAQATLDKLSPAERQALAQRLSLTGVFSGERTSQPQV